jgi:HPt (histidine-containing phosphotransfer) domain-containing protein
MLEISGTQRPEKTESGAEIPALDDHDPPIDLVCLGRQCQGDPGLEEELLGLFRRLAAARLSDPRIRLARKGDIAHKLRGSALTVGARRVARAAEAVEALANGAAGGSEEESAAVSLAIAELQAAVAEAVAMIERLGR